MAQDGRVWFVGQGGDYAAVFNPPTGQFRRHDLPKGSGPHTVYITRDQKIWYAGNQARHLGRIDADSGKIHQLPMPQGELGDPHTLYEDARGRLWFTAQWANQVGRLDRKTGDIAYIDVPTENARPYGMVIDDRGIVWVALFGSNKLARITPDMKLSEITLPRSDARPRRLAITGQGIWYVDYAEGYLGVYDPASGDIREWRHGRGEPTGPYAMASDARGRIWFVETHPDPSRLVEFDPASEAFVSTDIPGRAGHGAVRHMVYDRARNAIWFGTDSNRLVRADLPE